MELIDPALLELIRRDGVLLHKGSGATREFCFLYGRWRFFFRPRGPGAPENGADENQDAIPDYVERILCKLERGYALLRDLFALPEPLDETVRHIDVHLDDIPALHGVAAGRARTVNHPLLAGTPHAGPALGVRLHRALIDQTATPQHEVFHLFQYRQVPLVNGWFMEGLATWYHRLFKHYPAKEEELPGTEAALISLLARKHDAEAFWNRLFRLCDDRKGEVQKPYCDYFEVKQKQFPGRVFLRHMLGFLAQAWAASPLSDQPKIESIDIRSLPYNNTLIFDAILKTIAVIEPKECEELSNFLALLRRSAALSRYAPPPVQDLMRDLQRLKTCPVYEQQGLLYSPFYDPLTATLIVETLSLRAPPPPSFSGLRRIQGNLSLERDQAEEFTGFPVLDSISGSLTIANNARLVTLSGFPALGEVGTLLLQRNPRLESVSGLSALQTVRRDLRLNQCPRLQEIEGLRQLRTVGGILELADLSALNHVRFLRSLESLTSLTIRNCPITSAESLQPLFANSPDFRGGIRITNTELQDVRFMAGLRHVESSFYVSENLLNSLEGLENLETVGASFTLASNQISDLTPLRKLRSVEGILSVSNNALKSLEGLENLRRLRTKKWGETPSTLRIYGNPELQDISSISNVEDFYHYLILHLDQNQSFTRQPPAEAPFYRNVLHIQDFRTAALIPRYRFAPRPVGQRLRTAWQAVASSELECLVDLETPADSLILCFGGRSNGRFWPLLEGLKAHRVFLSDPRDLWYQGAAAGIGKDLESTLSFLRGIAEAQPYKTILCLGAASGAYMAMLVGWLIQAHHVIALQPRTTLPPDILPNTVNPLYRDLEALFAAHPNNQTRIWLFHGDAEDTAHTSHLTPRANFHDLERELPDLSPAEALQGEAFLALATVLDQSCEFIEGRLYPLAPDTPRQTTIRLNIASWLYNKFRANRFRVHVTYQKLRIFNNFLCPGLFVSSSETSKSSQHYQKDALMVIEMLGNPLMAFDRGRRFDLFTKLPSLQDYVVIDAETERVRIWHREDNRWEEEDLALGADLPLESLETTIPASIIFANRG